MVALDILASDPDWLPHAVDPSTRTVQFVRIDRATLSSRGFLAELGDDRAVAFVSFADLEAMNVPRGPMHFIFHSGFCHSTLMAKAMDIPGVSVPLNEPRILNDLARLDRPHPSLVGAVAGLLSRPRGNGEAVIVKPSNFANGLIPALLDASSESSAVLMTNGLRSFLEAVVRKGMRGRQWGRQVFLQATRYTGNLFKLDMQACAGLSDLQLAGMGWLVTQYWFEGLLSRHQGGRLEVLHGERFNVDRGATIEAVASLMNLRVSRERIATIETGPVFRLDAKTGGDFAKKQAEDAARSKSIVIDEEIAEVEEMVATNARIMRLAVPAAQTLF